MIMLRTPVRLLGLIGFALMLSCGAAQAARSQYAPTPKKAPRTPVKRQTLVAPNPALPASRLLEGKAHVIDTERLKIDNIEVRLFGIVPPQLSASYGPQARSVVDALAQGSVTCKIRDRDRDGRLLASCHNSNNADFGVELLRRGLAVTARGSLRPTELAQPYIAAEDAAKAQRLGLWSVKQPAAASEKSIREAVLQAETAKKEKAAAEAAKKAAEKAAQEAKEKEQQAAAEQPPALTVVPVETTASVSPVPQIKPDEKVTISLGPSAADIQALLEAPPAQEATPVVAEDKGFFETYQLLATGLIALLTMLVGAGAYLFSTARDKRNELRAIAAALRGEMMAARSVCLARLSRMAHDDKDGRATSWPRIRTLVFQAYVSRLGHLGADMARQIASIYGQASDYASYYVGADGKPEQSSKRQSLQTLVQHIEEVVPKLADIERVGSVARPKESIALSSLLARVVRPLSLPSLKKFPSAPPDGGSDQTATLPAPENRIEAEVKEAPAPLSLDKAKAEIVSEAEDIVPEEPKEEPKAETPEGQEEKAETKIEPEAKQEESTAEPTEEKTDEKKEEEPRAEKPEEAPPVLVKEESKQPAEKPAASPKQKQSPQQAKRSAMPRAAAAMTGAKARQTKPAPAQQTAAKTTLPPKASELWEKVNQIDVKSTFAEGLARLKAITSEGIDRLRPGKPYEGLIPDYANLTEEELEALAYSEEDYFLNELEEGDGYGKVG